MAYDPHDENVLETLIEEFVSILQSGQQPDVQEFLDKLDSTDSRDSLQDALLRREAEERLKRGEKNVSEVLAQRFPKSDPEHRSALLSSLERQAQEQQTLVDSPRDTKYEDASQDMPTIVGTSSSESPEPNDDAKTIVGSVSDKTTRGQDQATYSINPSDSKDISSRQTTSPGNKEFGDYELIKEIARGGMGVVYKARQRKLNRVCALKMILTGQLAGEEEVQRFYAEAESAANLSHSGIVPIFEVGQIDGQHFFSMGFVEGHALSDEVSEGPLKPERAAEMTREIAEAIAYAHQNGLIHRDLKPANVLIDADGTLKVTDFGLAKRTEHESGLTATGQILGTPSYMPPEQAAGKTDDVDETSDVYALGGILYCLLTGRPPFQAATPMDTLIQVMDAEPVAPTKLNAQVPKDLETICLKCLAKERHRRFASADDLIAELSRFISGEPIESRPISQVERAWRWCKRKPVIASLAATATALALFVLIAAPIAAVQQSQLRQQAQIKEGEATESARIAKLNEDRAEQLSDLADERRRKAEKDYYATSIALAHGEWLKNNVIRAKALLALAPEEYRDWEYYYLQSLFGSEEDIFREFQMVFQVAVNEDDNFLIARGIRGNQIVTRTIDLVTGLEISTRPGGQLISPDGKRAVFTDGRFLRVESLSDNSEIGVIDIGNANDVRGAVFNDDASLLAICVSDGQSDGANKTKVMIYEVISSRLIATLHGTPSALPLIHAIRHPYGNQLAMDFSNDSSQLVVGGPQPPSMMQVWDIETETQTHEYEAHIFNVSRVSISPDGNLVASAAFDGVVKVWNLEENREHATLRGHLAWVYDVAFSPDGDFILTGGWDRTVKVWMTKTGQEVITLRGATAPVFDLSLADNGTKIFAGSSDGSIRSWRSSDLMDLQDEIPARVIDRFVSDEDPAKRVRIIQELTDGFVPHVSQEFETAGYHGTPTQTVALSPDGSLIATSGHDERVRIWAANSGQLLHEFEAFAYIHAMQFDPTGRFLAYPNGKLGFRFAGSTVPSPGWIEIRDVESGELVRKTDPIDTPISGVAFSHDGTRIASACGLHKQYADRIGIARNKNGRIILWDAETLEQIWVQESHVNMSSAVCFSGDDRRIASTGMDAMVRVWDAESGELIEQFSQALANTCAYSADGRYLATASVDGVIRIWNAKTHELLHRAEGHYGAINKVAFNPSGTRLFSAGNDATVRVWDPSEGNELLKLQGHTGEVFGVAMNDQGRFLATVGYDGITKLWDRGNPNLLQDEIFSEELFVDEFERDELDSDWYITKGQFAIEDGALRATIENSLNEVLGIHILAATAYRLGMELPDDIEAEFDVWFDKPAGFQLAFLDEVGFRGEFCNSLGVPSPYDGLQTTDISTMSGGANISTVARVPFMGLTAGDKHHVVIRRSKSQIRVRVDGNEVVFADLRTMPNASIAISGIYGEVGEHVWFDNLVVRTTPRSLVRKQARDYVVELSDRFALRSELIESIENDESLDPDVAEAAVEIAEELRLDPPRVLKRLGELAQTGDRSQEVIQLGLESSEELVQLRGEKPEYLLMLGYWQWLDGNEPEATSSIRRAEELFVKAFHFHPATLAILAICNQNRSITPARELLARAEDRFRGRHWQADSFTSYVIQQARSAVGRDSDVAPSDTDFLVDQLIAGQQALWIDLDISILDDLLSDDCVVELTHPLHLPELEFEIDKPRFLDGTLLLQTGDETTTLEYDDIAVEVSEDNATVRWIGHIWNGAQVFRTEFEWECQRRDERWQVVRFHQMSVARVFRAMLMDYQEDQASLDEAVETARAKGNEVDLIWSLTNASRTKEAYEIVRRRSLGRDAGFDEWQMRGQLAMFGFQVDDSLRSLEKGVEFLEDGSPFKKRTQLTIASLYITLQRLEDVERLYKSIAGDDPDAWRNRIQFLRAVQERMVEHPGYDPESANSFCVQLLDESLATSDNDSLSPDIQDRIREWYASEATWILGGPFPGGPDTRGLDAEYPPELTPEWPAMRVLDQRKRWVRQIEWKTAQAYVGDLVDLRKELADRENAAAFAYAEFTVDEPMSATLRLGTDDGTKVFLDGKMIHKHRPGRAWREGQDQIDVQLDAGTHKLLVKVNQNSADWGYSVDFADVDGWPIIVDWEPITVE